MPRAFLMQYKKKPKVNVIYQEADTTEARQMMSKNDESQANFSTSQTTRRKCAAKSMTKVQRETIKTADELMDDEEISVTDSEDDNVMLNRGCYDDSGCHEDEEDFQDEEDEDDEDDTETEDDDKDEEEEEEEMQDDEEDDEDEEINVGDSEFGHLENQAFLYNQYQNFINQQQQNLAAPDENEDAAKDVENHVKEPHSGEHKLESFGKHHSAFRKPVVKREGHLENGHDPTQRVSMLYGPEFGTYMDTRHPVVTNYWLHMSKMYNGNLPPPLPPYHPPSTLPGSPLDHGAHLEALHKQMLHHNMLYIKSQGGVMLPPGHHPAMPMYYQPQHVPGMPLHPAHVSPRSIVSPTGKAEEGSDSRSDTSPATSGEKSTTSPANSRTSQMSDAIRLRHERSKENGHVSPRNKQTPVMRPTQQLGSNRHNIPLGMGYPFPSPIHPAHQVSSALHPMTSPPHMTSPVTSSVSPTMNPYLYQGILGYGTRRPRDPNKPPPVKKYKCDICSKAFSRSNTLVTHRRIHTGEKPFKCEVCSRAFRQPGNLTRHRLTHTTVKPYVCVVCKKAFNRASNLHTHMRTHSNFRPFLCPYCGKSFQQKVDLKIHMYTHGGAVPTIQG